MAVRKVVTRSGRHVRGYFPSVKNGRMVAWESLLERDAIILFEFSSAVVSYHEQPSIETYYEDDLPRRYFPDFSLTFRSEEQVDVEVKPERKLRSPKNEKRFALISDAYELRDKGFLILTEKEIRQEPRLSNLKLLAHHCREIPHPMQVKEMLTPIEEIGSLPISAISEFFGDAAMAYRLLAAGLLTCDLSKPIQKNTQVHVNKGDTNHDSFYF